MDVKKERSKENLGLPKTRRTSFASEKTGIICITLLGDIILYLIAFDKAIIYNIPTLKYGFSDLKKSGD